jgi:outer membrane protein TolC
LKAKLVQVSVCLSAVLLSPLFSFSEEQSPSPVAALGLKSAITLAYKSNKDIQIQEKQIEASRANILLARSPFYPQANLTASYTYYEDVFVQNVFLGYKNNNLLSLGVIQNLYSGGAHTAGLRQAELYLKISEETLRAKKLDLEFDTKRLYYGLLLAFELERIARESLGQSMQHYKNVQQMFDQGTASRFDVLQSKVQVSLLEPQLVKAKNEIDIIKAEINKLLARSVDTEIAAVEKLGYVPLEVREQEFLQTAYLDKPEMRLKALGVDIDKWQIQMAKSGYRPQINLSANYQMQTPNIGTLFERKQANWNFGASLTFPVFEGFSTKAKVDAAKAQYSQAKLSQENTADQVAVDIRRACLNLAKAEAVIKSQKDNVGEAKEALRISEVSFANGVAINLDVLDSQVSLSQIETNLASAVYDYLMAQAALERNIAKFYVTEEKNEK